MAGFHGLRLKYILHERPQNLKYIYKYYYGVLFIWNPAKTHRKQAFLCSGKNTQSGNTSHHRVALPHASSKMRSMEAKTNEGISTTSDSASNINTASSYDYLKQFYEKVSDDLGGKNLTSLYKLCLSGFKKQLRTSTMSTANLKQHIELKHPASLSRYVWVKKNQKTR